MVARPEISDQKAGRLKYVIADPPSAQFCVWCSENYRKTSSRRHTSHPRPVERAFSKSHFIRVGRRRYLPGGYISIPKKTGKGRATILEERGKISVHLNCHKIEFLV